MLKKFFNFIKIIVMKAIEAIAVFDENCKLNIENPPIVKNKKVRLLILIVEEEHEADFNTLSEQSLSKAYSYNEPEYNFSLIKEPNPAYIRR